MRSSFQISIRPRTAVAIANVGGDVAVTLCGMAWVICRKGFES